MKEIKDFMHMIGDLASISDCPNFSDEMRNISAELMMYINDNIEPEENYNNKFKPINGMYHYFSEYDGKNIIAVLKQYNGGIDEWVKIK